jgi:hypothetical protein
MEDRERSHMKVGCRFRIFGRSYYTYLCVSWIEAVAFWSRRAGKAVSGPVDNNHIGEKIGRDTNRKIGRDTNRMNDCQSLHFTGPLSY